MARRLTARFRSDRGQALVELAFVLPIVMLILFGIIDFGLALNNYNADTNLANLAARSASVMGTTTSIGCGTQTDTTLKAFVTCEAAATGAPTPTYVCFADTSSGSPSATLTTGDSLKIQVQSNFGWLKLLTGGNGYVKGIGLNSTISASATMRIEQAPSTGTNPFFSTTATPLCAS